jgi:hypothetical protein
MRRCCHQLLWLEILDLFALDLFTILNTCLLSLCPRGFAWAALIESKSKTHRKLS